MGFDATRMTRLGRVEAVALAPDGDWLAVQVARLDGADAAYVSDLWRVPLGGGEPVRLTGGETSDERPRFRRDGALCFLSSRPTGAEDAPKKRKQVFCLPAGGGEPYPLTDEPLGSVDFRFAAAADRLVLLAPVLPEVEPGEQRERARELSERGPSGLSYREMPVRFWDDWIRPAAPHFVAYREDGSERRDLTPAADPEYRPMSMPGLAWDLSPDGARVAVRAIRPGPDRLEDAALHLIDTATGKISELGKEARVTHDAPRFSPDGGRIACVRHVRERGRCGRPMLFLYDTQSGEGSALAEEWDAWPHPEAFTPDGAAILCTADAAGCVPVFRVETASGEVTRLTSESAGGSHRDLHTSGDSILGVRHRMLQPPEPFRLPIGGGEPELVARLSGWSASEESEIATVESLSVAGDGGDAVQSFLVRPVGASSSPRPALLWIHGGPIGQHADGWHWRWNPLIPAAAGYVVALPNPRGSTGFGQAFLEGVWNNEWGAACYRDLMAVTDALAEVDGVNGARIGAMGGSFGGYMANWIGANTDRFACLVSHAGIFHFSAFHGATDAPADLAEMIGLTPYDDEERFERYSPHRRLESWKTPTLIIHGEKDYRVPVSEALLLFEGLRLKGVEAELLVFPDENHWILKPRNSRQWYEEILAFLERHL